MNDCSLLLMMTLQITRADWGGGQRLAFVSNGWAAINARYIYEGDSISLMELHDEPAS